MAKLTIHTRFPDKVLRRAVEADHSAFYVGEDMHAVTGGRLTACTGDGIVTVTGTRLSEEELREIFAAFLSDPKDTK